MAKLLQLHPPAASAPIQPDRDLAPGLQTSSVYVLFTTVEETLAAVLVASSFAKALEVPLTVLHFRTVAYSQPVDAPAGISPIETADFMERLHDVDVGDAGGPDVRVRVCLCREVLAALPLELTNPSLIVIGERRRCWGYLASRSARWRRALEARGHLVIFSDVASGTARTKESASA